MTDLEISKALALAIGWEDDLTTVHLGFLYVAYWPRKDNRKSVLHNRLMYCPPLMPWRAFDYRDPAVIWPIAERYEAFPHKIVYGYDKGKWIAFQSSHSVTCDTAAKAVAIAVIGAKT